MEQSRPATNAANRLLFQRSSIRYDHDSSNYNILLMTYTTITTSHISKQEDTYWSTEPSKKKGSDTHS